MNKIIRRVLTILPAVLLQLVWLAVLFSWLAPWAGAISFVLSVLAFLLVLYIITKQDEGTYKIIWLLLVLTVPLPGALLYLIFGNKRTTKPLRKKLAEAKALPVWEDGSAPLYEELSAADSRAAQTFRTVQNATGFPLCPNRSADYYPLGDDMFPVMLQELEKAERFIFVEYFILEDGLMWDSMVEVMARKAAQGVDVRVLYDDLAASAHTPGKTPGPWQKGASASPPSIPCCSSRAPSTAGTTGRCSSSTERWPSPAA